MPDLTVDAPLRPLPAIDHLLLDSGSLSAGSSAIAEFPATFAEALLTYLNVPQRDWRIGPVSALFSHSLPLGSKKVTSACLVRLWSTCPDVFSNDVRFRNQTLALFDAVFGAELYPRLKLREKSQTHEKIAGLIEALRETEAGLRAAADILQDTKSVQAFEKAFFNVYNRTPATFLVAPFLPKHDFHARLHAITAAVEAYCSATPSEVVSAYESALSAIDARLADAREVGTDYCDALLSRPLNRLRSDLIRSFDSSPLRQNAVFRITRSDKKYPFHTTNLPVNLEVEIENIGPGYALELEISVKEISSGRLVRTTFQLGDMPPSKRLLPVELVLDTPITEVLADFELTWLTFDRQQHTSRTTLEFTGQRSDIDWAALSVAEPYDVEPISDDSQLIGRSEILQQLIGMATAATIGSAIVHGQKRVGKTSIVKALQSKLAKADHSITSIYVLVGDYVRPDPIRSIQALGVRLCEEIRDSDPDLAGLPLPTFDDAVAPLGDLIRSVQRRRARRFLFILDEFDELPTDLYSQNEIANAFFLGLRSLSARPDVGFILVSCIRNSFTVVRKRFIL